MDNTFTNPEKLYRAVFPESYKSMYWRRDGKVSSAAFFDPDGLSVERGDFRKDEDVVKEMKKFFKGCIVSVTVEQCNNVDAVVRYKPSTRSKYHSEIHGSEDNPVLSGSQRKKLANVANMEYYEE